MSTTLRARAIARLDEAEATLERAKAAYLAALEARDIATRRATFVEYDAALVAKSVAVRNEARVARVAEATR